MGLVSPHLIRLVFLVVVSEIMKSFICYKLDKNLDGNKIIQDIKNLLSGRENLSNSLLEIHIRTIAYEDTSHIPKLEYKHE